MSKAVRNQNKHISIFTDRWNKWRSYLQKLVEAHNGKLICPAGRELVTVIETQAKSIKVTLPYPICIYNIPKKLRGKGTATLSVFIDGKYELEEDPKDHIRRIGSQVAFYEMSSKAQPEFKLLDAYHFDFFDSDVVANHDPHPTFHAQREITISSSQPRFNSALNQLSGHKGHTFTNHSPLHISELFRLGSFRIPTPQLDVLNLAAVVAADKLVGNNSKTCWNDFQSMLECIHGHDGQNHHVKNPKKHKAKIYDAPRKQVADWYCKR